MSIIRKRSAAHKAYLPGNVRDNQYILAEFCLTDELVQRLSGKYSATKAQPFMIFIKSYRAFFLSLPMKLSSIIASLLPMIN